MGYVMVTPSSPVGRRRAGVTHLFLRLGMAVLLLCIAVKSSTILPDRTNGVKEGPDKFYCFRLFQRCKSGIEQCIRPRQECDGVKDCADGSDEGDDCALDCIAGGRYICPSGRMCMSASENMLNDSRYDIRRLAYDDPYTMYLCDGLKDCADGSDEDPSFCASYDCNANMSHTPLPDTWLRQRFRRPPQHRRKCLGGEDVCVTDAQLCDGVVHCPGDGGSDESDEFCKQHECSPSSLSKLFQCRSGRCISREALCDGRQDCPDGEDEDGENCAETVCKSGSQKCGGMYNGTCIRDSQVCDGVEDCPGGTDEMSCMVCPSGKPCANYYLCDGVKQCRDGSDEDPELCRSHNCSDSYAIKCKDGVTCVARQDLCNGIQNCPDKSDEDPVFCRTRHDCPSVPLDMNDDSSPLPKIRCPGSEYVWCTQDGGLCNGIPDCYNGEDEKPEFCGSEEITKLMASRGLITCLSNTTHFINGYYCDGIEHCADRSDERPGFCELYECLKGKVKCYGKWCVSGRRCDGKFDCPDGSDEEGCPS